MSSAFIKTIKQLAPLSILLLITSCATETFHVSEFHLRSESMLKTPSEPVKGEARFHLDRALTEEDYRQKRGHYFTVKWKDKLLRSDTSPLEITLQYRQAKTGREILSRVVRCSPTETSKIKIPITGDPYLQGGRILAWKAFINQEGQILATEQSFLWE